MPANPSPPYPPPPPQVDDFTAYVIANNGSGMMIWSLEKPGTPSATNITNHMCTGLGLSNCTAPLPPSN